MAHFSPKFILFASSGFGLPMKGRTYYVCKIYYVCWKLIGIGVNISYASCNSSIEIKTMEDPYEAEFDDDDIGSRGGLFGWISNLIPGLGK